MPWSEWRFIREQLESSTRQSAISTQAKRPTAGNEMPAIPCLLCGTDIDVRTDKNKKRIKASVADMPQFARTAMGLYHLWEMSHNEKPQTKTDSTTNIYAVQGAEPEVQASDLGVPDEAFPAHRAAAPSSDA